MNGVEIIGIKDHQRSKILKERVEKALKILGISLPVREITDLEAIVNADISATPALRVNGKVILQQILPNLEDLTGLLEAVLAANRTVNPKKMILPTDFSSTSKNAYQFALQLAPLLELSLKVIHVYNNSIITYGSSMEVSSTIRDYNIYLDQLSDFVQDNEQDMEALSLSKTMIEYDVKPGFPKDELLRLSGAEDVEMMLIGATGENNFGDRLFGTLSAAVARQAKCPVLLVPNHVVFKGFKKILVATDYLNIKPAILKELMRWAGFFQASIHFVHVRESSETGNYREVIETVVEEFLKDDTPRFSFQMTTINASTVREGLNNYIEKESVDLLAMIVPERDFFSKLFHKSLTKQMAAYATIPMLMFHTGK